MAANGLQRIIVEAKGETSSKSHTKRFGKPFSAGQVFDHVGKAVLKALRVASSGEARAAVAFPDNPHHRREIEQVRPAVERAGIGVFWVQSHDDGRRAEFDGPLDAVERQWAPSQSGAADSLRPIMWDRCAGNASFSPSRPFSSCRRVTTCRVAGLATSSPVERSPSDSVISAP